MNTSLSKKEIDFIFNTIVPLNLDKIKDETYKSKLTLLLNTHNPEKIISLETRLEKENLTKEQHYEKAFEDTLNYFLLELITNKQKRYFSKIKMYEFKDDFIHLFQYNSFYHFDEYVISVQFYMFLGYLNDTFKTLEEHSRDERLSRGTAFLTSSYKDGLESSLNFVRKQLDTEQPFSTITTMEKERLKVNKISIKTFRNHTSVANFMITLNAMYNFDKLKIDCTDGEKEGFKQSFSYLNGLKTSKEEIVRSFMIKATFPYYKKEIINKTRLAQIIHNIAQSFFPEIVYIQLTKRKNKDDSYLKSYTLGLNPKTFKYNLYIKTALNGNTIYAYDRKKEYTWLIKGSLKDALKLIKKIYLEEGHSEIVNNPLFDKTIKKLIKSPIYPL
jgi:hypothetical protein